MEPQKAKYSEQMKAWALDRAIEAHKLRKDSAPLPSEIIQTANSFVEWVSNPEELADPMDDAVAA